MSAALERPTFGDNNVSRLHRQLIASHQRATSSNTASSPSIGRASASVSALAPSERSSVRIGFRHSQRAQQNAAAAGSSASSAAAPHATASVSQSTNCYMSSSQNVPASSLSNSTQQQQPQLATSASLFGVAPASNPNSQPISSQSSLVHNSSSNGANSQQQRQTQQQAQEITLACSHVVKYQI